MEGRIMAVLMFIMMMLQSTEQKITLTSDTVVGNILFESSVLLPLAMIILIVTLMI
jgi:hypothetical protein